jgi:hypothetical protein
VVLAWFDTRELDDFADAIVAELVRRYPPSGEEVGGKKAFERLRRSFGATFDKIDRFLSGHKLNVYKKARFANRVRWALTEAGYRPDFVATMTEEVVTHVTVRTRWRNKT